MTKKDNSLLKVVADNLMLDTMGDLMNQRDRLERCGFKREAKQVDAIISKINILAEKMYDKAI
jgi:hypothetical protein